MADDPWASFETVAPAVADPWSGFEPAGGALQVRVKPRLWEPPAAPPMSNVTDAAGTAYGDEPYTRETGPSMVDLAGRGIANGATLGFADRIAAAMGAMTGLGGTFGDYSGNLAAQQAATKAMHEREPALAMAAEGAGALAAPIGVGVKAAMAAPNVATRVLAGTGAGGILGSVQGAASSPDLTDAGDTGRRAGIGAVLGAGMGASLPAVSAAAGQTYRGVADRLAAMPEGLGKPAVQKFLEALGADGSAVAGATLNRLGPEGMLIDAGPALRGTGSGIAQKPGPARSTVLDALTTRNDGTYPRLQAETNAALGPAQSPVAATADIQAQRLGAADTPRSTVKAMGASPVDVTDTLALIGDRLRTATGPEAALLQRARANLSQMDPKTGKLVVESHPERLHNLKQDLDTAINYGDPGLGIAPGSLARADGAAKQVRGSLNDALREQVPGYATANDASSALARQAEAIEYGQGLIGQTGRDAPWPGDVAGRLAAMPAPEQQAVRTGVRGDIERRLGVRENDLEALRGVLQGEGGWGAQNVGTVFGQDAAGRLSDAVSRERTMRGTYNDIVGNSQTAPRRAAEKAMEDAPAPTLDLHNVSGLGLIAGPTKRAFDKAYGALFRTDNTLRDTQLAEGLTRQGPAAQSLLDQLLEIETRRQALLPASRAFGDRAAIGAGLLADQTGRGLSRDR